LAAVLALLVIALSAMPPASDASDEAGMAADETVSFLDVEEIVLTRCSMCHATEPVWQGMPAPPKGVVLETPEQIRLHADAINVQSVRTHAMPPSNITEMEPGERAVLGAWIAAGAQTQE
jgi:uncharacterized membrane protein